MNNPNRAAQAALPMANTTSFELDQPIVYANQTYTVINLRRPKVKDLQVLSDLVEKDPIKAQSMFLATLAGGHMPYQAFEELDLEDARKLNKWVEGFTRGTENS